MMMLLLFFVDDCNTKRVKYYRQLSKRRTQRFIQPVLWWHNHYPHPFVFRIKYIDRAKKKQSSACEHTTLICDITNAINRLINDNVPKTYVNNPEMKRLQQQQIENEEEM